MRGPFSSSENRRWAAQKLVVCSKSFLRINLLKRRKFSESRILSLKLMSERPNRILLASPPRQNRDSHINLGLIGHSLRPRPQEYSRPGGDSLEPIEESAAAQNSSAQLRSFYPTESNTNMGYRLIPIGSVTPAKREQGSGRIKHDSPWKSYEEGYDLKLESFVKVAVRKAPLHGKVAIRKFAGRNATCELDMLRRVRHERFVQVLEVFEFETVYHVVFEHVSVTLREVVGCAAFPSERQLAAILGQVGSKRGARRASGH